MLFIIVTCLPFMAFLLETVQKYGNATWYFFSTRRITKQSTKNEDGQSTATSTLHWCSNSNFLQVLWLMSFTTVYITVAVVLVPFQFFFYSKLYKFFLQINENVRYTMVFWDSKLNSLNSFLWLLIFVMFGGLKKKQSTQSR